MTEEERLIQVYSNYSDEQLIELVKKSFSDLTNTSQELILRQIENRKLVFPELSQFQNKLEEIRRNSLLKKLQLESIKLKRAGKNDRAIEDFLVQSGLKEAEVSKIVTYLPSHADIPAEFDEFIRTKCQSNQSGFNLRIIFFVVAALMLIGYAIFTSISLIYFVSLVWIIIGVIFYLSNKDLALSSDYWLSRIKDQNQDFIWLKPINLKTKLYFVLTIDEENYFELLTSDRKKLTVKCSKVNDNITFISGLKAALPQVHIGYNEQIEKIYQSDPNAFLRNLEAQNLYSPVKLIAIA